jgi:hypothetical protein
MSAIAELSPRDYVLQHEKLEYFAAKHFKKEVPAYTPTFQEFNVPQEILSWLQDEFSSDKKRKKSLILIGPSKIGKTQWARSLGRHMYFNHLANFKDDWDDEAKYIVFDDFEFDYIPNKKGFFGGQERFQISGKYMKIKRANVVFTAQMKCLQLKGMKLIGIMRIVHLLMSITNFININNLNPLPLRSNFLFFS